jgi:hypothetical protein
VFASNTSVVLQLLIEQAVDIAIMPACLLEDMEDSGLVPPNAFRVGRP